MKKNQTGFRVKDDDFVKSSWSKNNPQTCVMVNVQEEFVAIRDSKDESKATLFFSHDEWKAFLKGAEAGEFNIKK